MSAERRLIVILGGLIAAVALLKPQLGLPAVPLLVALLATVTVQFALLMRVRRAGCRPIWQRDRG